MDYEAVADGRGKVDEALEFASESMTELQRQAVQSISTFFFFPPLPATPLRLATPMPPISDLAQSRAGGNKAAVADAVRLSLPDHDLTHT